MNINELYLKTIFCCMACDGDIAPEEVAMVKTVTSNEPEFKDLDVEGVVNDYIAAINDRGAAFLKQYLKEVSQQEMTDGEQMKVIDLAVRTIMADNVIEYSEVKFFKKTRSRLSLTDEQILEQHPDIEDWLLPDIKVAEDPEWDTVVFNEIKF